MKHKGMHAHIVGTGSAHTKESRMAHGPHIRKDKHRIVKVRKGGRSK